MGSKKNSKKIEAKEIQEKDCHNKENIDKNFTKQQWILGKIKIFPTKVLTIRKNTSRIKPILKNSLGRLIWSRILIHN